MARRKTPSAYFDIIHCDAADGFANHVAMAVGQIDIFSSLYTSTPSSSWSRLGGLRSIVKSAKANQSLLRHTEVYVPGWKSASAYGFGHWEGTAGHRRGAEPEVNENASYHLDLARCGAPERSVRCRVLLALPE